MYSRELRAHLKRGNIKIGKDTIIYNLDPAHDCAALELGLCKVGSAACYAYNTERFRKQALPYRRRQRYLWGKYASWDFFDTIMAIQKRSRSGKIKYFRLNESGEFRNQDDVDKFSNLAKLLKAAGIQPYTYTTRIDLDLSELKENCVLTLSDEVRPGYNTFKPVDRFTGKNLECHNDCRKCNLCKTQHGRIIEVKKKHAKNWGMNENAN